MQWLISALVFGIGFSLYTAINLYGVLVMENSPPGLSGTAHAIVALAANGEKCWNFLKFFFFTLNKIVYVDIGMVVHASAYLLILPSIINLL